MCGYIKEYNATTFLFAALPSFTGVVRVDD